MRRATQRLSGAVVAHHGAASNKPFWWTHPIAVPPAEMEFSLFQNAVEKEVPAKYKPHPWFRNFGQNRTCIVDPPPKGEFFRFIAFWNVMKEKSRQLGVKGSLMWLILQMRRQREAWYAKGFDLKLVGVDELGNKYWQSTYCATIQSRCVEYPERSAFNTDVTVVSPEWYQWLHHLPDAQPFEMRQRFPDCYGKGHTSDYWYKMKWTELLYDGDRPFYPKGHAHPSNDKFEDFVLRQRRVSKRRGVMEFDPFVLPAERLRKRQKQGGNPANDRKHAKVAEKMLM